MKAPSLQKTAALSTGIHITFLVIAMILTRQSYRIITPSPYIVNLVSSSQKSAGSGTKTREAPKKIAAKKETRTAPEVSKQELQQRREKMDAERVSSRISELEAKKKADRRIEDRIAELEAKKRIDQIVRLRSMISLSRSGEGETAAASEEPAAGPLEGSLMDQYYWQIREEIWQEWVYPELGDGNLEAVIFVKIGKDGAVTVQGIEKSSGNAVFDRSALRALSKASPVTPPPYEMEIGIRFYP